MCLRRSCYEAARRKRLAPFRAAGFRCAAAAWALPDAELFARQRRQFLEGGAAVPDAAMADMRGPPSAVHTGHCSFSRHGKKNQSKVAGTSTGKAERVGRIRVVQSSFLDKRS